jgi:peptide deformylase
MLIANPAVAERSDEISTFREGCLSLPGAKAEIMRPSRCVVTGLGYDGGPVRLEAAGLLATCLQHEIDHLEGVLFIDRLSKIKRDMALRKAAKAARAARR